MTNLRGRGASFVAERCGYRWGMAGPPPNRHVDGGAEDWFIFAALAGAVVAWLGYTIRYHGWNPFRWPWREWW
jgi:hypothetical protein